MRFNLAHFFTTLIVLPHLVLGFSFRDRSLRIRGTTNLQRRSWTPSHAGHGTLLPRVADGTDIEDLEAAALGFIKLMQSIENGKYKEREVLVIGGQAIAHYYPGYRTTDVTARPDDTDLKIQSGNPSVKSMKEAIARNSDGKFEIGLGASLWKLDNGKSVNIDAVDSDLSPYVPVGFVPASSVNSVGDLPYISKPDLLVSKLISCNERVGDDKAKKDALDAYQVVANELTKGGISLTKAQKDAINENKCMDRVYEVTCTTAKWWEKSLGLQT
ncbi:MAG: hypothetical protein Q9214_001686 [Letrouitia sp. 1 TL-2023]